MKNNMTMLDRLGNLSCITLVAALYSIPITIILNGLFYSYNISFWRIYVGEIMLVILSNALLGALVDAEDEKES